MKIFTTKIWIPAVLFMIVLLSAIAVIVVFQIRINQLNEKISDLNDLLVAEQQENGDALTGYMALKKENDALKTENDALQAANSALGAENETLRTGNVALGADNEKLKQYQLTLTVPSSYDIAIDQRLEPELVAMIKKHFSATASGNLDAYRYTLLDKNSDYLLGFYEQRKNSDISVTSMSAPDIMGSGPLNKGPIFLAVTSRIDGVLNINYIGVTKNNNKWVVYDYD